ncbi:MAG: hypothetical protein LBN27_01900 [Prevotellaceae bacterium]|nr:hypothetical protein [Prevotellaceae bacterium]
MNKFLQWAILPYYRIKYGKQEHYNVPIQPIRYFWWRIKRRVISKK